MTKKFHFTLVMPNYTLSSNGVMVLYLLADLLEQSGHRVTFVPLDMEVFIKCRHDYPAKYLDKFETTYGLVDPDSIAIIPETAPAETVSTLASQRRVWYLLNKPIVLTHEPILYRPDDLTVAYSGLISKIYFNLFILREISELNLESLSGPATPKEDLLLFYYGKSISSKIPGSIRRLIKSQGAKVVVINRTFPKSRDLLFNLLKRARLLVSYDPFTNLNYEATLCGTPCYIFDNYMHLNFSDFNIPLHGIFENKQEIEHYYNHGLNHDLVVQNYQAAITNNKSVVAEFVQLCEDWFNLTSQLNQTKVGHSLLFQQNELRILNDRLAHGKMGFVHISTKLHGYVSPPLRIKDRIQNRLHRLRLKLYRTWYKHFRGIRGPALDQKLKEV
jgi:hypothetical protein